MHKILLRFGLIAGVFLIGFNQVGEWIIKPTMDNYQLGERVGYLGILLAMSLIFFAVRKCRNLNNDRALGFSTAFGMGLVTDLVASALYGLYMIYYFASLSPEFLASYLVFARNQVRESGLPAEEIAAQLADLDANAGLYTNPYYQGLVMFATVFMVGALVSLLTAIVLKKRESDSA
jgi:uncharacterized membrane protein